MLLSSLQMIADGRLLVCQERAAKTEVHGGCEVSIGEGDICHRCLKIMGPCCAREESGYQVGSLGFSSFHGNAGASEEIIP